MEQDKKNLAIICDIRNNNPVGAICACPLTGDIAYSTSNNMLNEVLEIIFDHKMFLLTDEIVDNHDMIVENEIAFEDSYYLVALNYALPFPWRILGVTSVEGNVEEIVKEAYTQISKGGIENEEIN